MGRRSHAPDPVHQAAFAAAGTDLHAASAAWADADARGDLEAAQEARMRWRDAMTRLTTIGPPTTGKVLPWRP